MELLAAGVAEGCAKPGETARQPANKSSREMLVSVFTRGDFDAENPA